MWVEDAVKGIKGQREASEIYGDALTAAIQNSVIGGELKKAGIPRRKRNHFLVENGTTWVSGYGHFLVENGTT